MPKAKQRRSELPKYHTEPWKPAPYDLSVATALRLLASGEAEPYQQQKAIHWIIQVCCATHDMSYRPGSERDSVLAEGKRHVGNQILKLINLSPDTLEKMRKENVRRPDAKPRYASLRPDSST